jgi:hypothetical protein
MLCLGAGPTGHKSVIHPSLVPRLNSSLVRDASVLSAKTGPISQTSRATGRNEDGPERIMVRPRGRLYQLFAWHHWSVRERALPATAAAPVELTQP